MGVRAGIMIPSASQISHVVVTPLRACTIRLTIRFCPSVSQFVSQVKNFEISTFTKMASSSQDIDAFHVSNALIELCAE